jgi:hypothetical protein
LVLADDCPGGNFEAPHPSCDIADLLNSGTSRIVQHAERHMRACGINISNSEAAHSDMSSNGTAGSADNHKKCNAVASNAVASESSTLSPWTERETANLLEAVIRMNGRQWSKIAALVGNRSEVRSYKLTLHAAAILTECCAECMQTPLQDCL